MGLASRYSLMDQELQVGMMVCPFYLVRLKYVFTSIRNLDITVYKKLMHVDRSASNPTAHVLVSSPYELARSIPAHIQDNLLKEVDFSFIPRPLLSQLWR